MKLTLAAILALPLHAQTCAPGSVLIAPTGTSVCTAAGAWVPQTSPAPALTAAAIAGMFAGCSAAAPLLSYTGSCAAIPASSTVAPTVTAVGPVFAPDQAQTLTAAQSTFVASCSPFSAYHNGLLMSAGIDYDVAADGVTLTYRTASAPQAGDVVALLYRCSAQAVAVAAPTPTPTPAPAPAAAATVSLAASSTTVTAGFWEATLTAAGGQAPYTFTLVGPSPDPPGAQLTGWIGGGPLSTPWVPGGSTAQVYAAFTVGFGSVSFQLQATDAHGAKSNALTFSGTI